MQITCLNRTSGQMAYAVGGFFTDVLRMAVTNITNHLKLCTYNCEGVRNSLDYISTLSSYDIICLQETWLFEHEVNSAITIDKYLNTGCSGIDNSKILQGRPHGGVSILYKRDIAQCIESVSLNTRRACAVKLTVDENCHVLVVCVYMPCDTQSISHIDTEYENVLNCLEVFLQSTECNAIIICGDGNT